MVCFSQPSRNLKRYHSSETMLLPARQLMMLMCFEARVIDAMDGGMTAKKTRYLLGIFLVKPHPGDQCLDAAKNQPAVER
jgi:hypothetical protein